jgi:RND family efflux transporter MFP subunit
MKRKGMILLAAALGLTAGYLARGAIEHRGHDAAPAAARREATRQLWTCGMHPQVIREEPGFCPICGMELTPLDASTESSGLTIDPVVVQNMGVRVATVSRGPVHRTLRTVAYLAEAQPNQHDVNLRVDGWIERLHAATEGMHLSKGDPLFDLYSPALQVGIDELIAARRAGESESARRIQAAAERKLRSLGLSQPQIDRMAGLEQAPRTVTFTSPVDGHLIDKPVVDGAAVRAGDRVMQIVDHSRLWIDAQVHEQDLAFAEVGQKVTTTVDGIPGRTFAGHVMFIHPHVEERTRTAMVRAWIDNPSLELRPGMYATIEIEVELTPDAVLVPREAVIDTGVRQVAFLSLGGGRFDAREVRMGSPSDDGMVEVLTGLEPGEVVVTSGQFLLDSESRFREAIAKFQEKGLLAPPAGHDHGGGSAPGEAPGSKDEGSSHDRGNH